MQESTISATVSWTNGMHYQNFWLTAIPSTASRTTWTNTGPWSDTDYHDTIFKIKLKDRNTSRH